MTTRLRTAVLLAGCFVLAGAIVLAVSAATYQRAVYESPTELTEQVLDRLGITRDQASAYLRAHPDALLSFDEPETEPAGDLAVSVNAAFVDVQADAQDALLSRSRRWTMAALLPLSLLAALAGWVIAGRALAPLRAMTAGAGAASGADLSGRVAVDGPHDEVRQLADTFNDMLDRLDRAFQAQRRFSAQVSHELRTPLAIIASEADVLLQGADEAQRAALERVRASTERAERIIGALLDLARSGSGDVRRATVPLDVLTGDVLGQLVNGPDWRRLRVDLDLDAAPVLGDGALLERVVTNLLANAAHHNRPDGVVDVRTGVDGDWSVLAISNSRPPADDDEPDGGGGGAPDTDARPRAGVGLTVVDAVLTAHGGALEWSWAPDTVTVTAHLPVARGRPAPPSGADH